jgi:hypothetical protein
MGLAPSTLSGIRSPQGANVADCRPFFNVQPFGMCQSPANPAVAGNLAATGGVLAPMPCTPNCAGSWIPGDPANIIEGFPALTPSSMLTCRFGGNISIVFSG